MGHGVGAVVTDDPDEFSTPIRIGGRPVPHPPRDRKADEELQARLDEFDRARMLGWGMAQTAFIVPRRRVLSADVASGPTP